MKLLIVIIVLIVVGGALAWKEVKDYDKNNMRDDESERRHKDRKE